MKHFASIIVLLVALTAIGRAQIISRGQTIVAGEYFIGTDPGEGNGTAISAAYGSATANVSFSAQVPQGSLVYFRFKSSDGAWSAPLPVIGSASTSSGATLAGGEYFVNNDPGIGKGTSFSIGSNGHIVIPSPPLSRGDTLYLRVKDSFGRWSPARAIQYNFSDLVSAQYYIKYANGSTTSPFGMSLADSLPNYPVFVATSPIIPAFSIGDTVYVRVQAGDSFWSNWTASPGVITSVQGTGNPLPKSFKLYQAYPNPFNPTTTIMYDLPKKSHVFIAIYDVLGRDVRTLVNEDKPAGSYRLTFDAAALPSGVYLYRLAAGRFTFVEKIVLIK